jgi:hypothetical protein
MRFKGSALIVCFVLCLGCPYARVFAQQDGSAAQQPGNPLLGHNLLRNGDAEQETNTFWAPGWDPDGTLQQAAYGQTAGEWEQGIQGAPHGGCCYFRLEWQGQNGSSKSASQEIDISGLASEIDAGKVWATLSGYLGGILQGGTTTSLLVTWLDKNGKPMEGFTISAAPWDLRHPFVGVASLVPRNQTELVPTGARKAIVRIMGKATGQSYTYTALADNLAFMLSESAMSY